MARRHHAWHGREAKYLLLDNLMAVSLSLHVVPCMGLRSPVAAFFFMAMGMIDLADFMKMLLAL